MNEKGIQQKMADLAQELIEKRYPVGWGGAAVIRTAADHYFTSVAIETANSHKVNEKVTHCLCLVRDDETSPYKVLSPCGICQERLRYWGGDVQVGVTTASGGLKFVTLDELQPYHWSGAYPPEELEHFSPN